MLGPLRPHQAQGRVPRVEEQALEVLEEGVSVLLNEALDGVDNVSGVVLHQEVLAVGQRLVGGVRPELEVVGREVEIPYLLEL